MRKFSSALLVAVSALIGTTDRAQAFGLPCCGCQINCVEKTIICYRPEMRCRQVACTVEKKVCREVTEMQKCVVPIPYTEMVKRDVYVYQTVTEEVEREIYVAVECSTPTCEAGCSGGCATGCSGGCTSGCSAGCASGCTGGCGHAGHCCKPNPASYKKTIKCMECKEKAVKVEISEPVCKVRTEERMTPVKRTIVEVVPETVMKTEYYCEMVPFEVKVTVPVCNTCGCGH